MVLFLILTQVNVVSVVIALLGYTKMKNDLLLKEGRFLY
ncbi:hypothetical protein BC749_11512 [Flavobacterium araucananum]|nr:hypothetical protein BC749_11512 [Flavobacterium araucananum]